MPRKLDQDVFYQTPGTLHYNVWTIEEVPLIP